MQYGLIGERLSHSYSKEIHQRIAGYDYALCELAPEQVPAFLAARAFRAINVTIPYKQTVLPYLAGIDDHARAIGAVNTVVNRDGELYGYNTDFYGMTAQLRRMGIRLRGEKALVLGSGGTARTARAVAQAQGVRMLLTVGRKAGEGVISYEEALQKHTDATVILNTTPCGMYPYPDGAPGLAGTPVDLSAFPNLAGVMDAVYNPLRTNLVLDAAARGIPAEGGLYMLVAQAVLASRLFVGQAASAADIDPDTDALCAQTYSRVRADKENVVLIGMPGSGKTTVGRALAEAMGRPFYDTDEELVKRTERDISAIFAQDGEAAFRDLETETIRSLTATVTGAVIATGGGAVLREENLRALRRNGRLYFLDRALQHLLPTSDRPLASSADAIRARYEERYALYCAACDCRVAVDEVPAHTVNTVRKDFYDER